MFFFFFLHCPLRAEFLGSPDPPYKEPHSLTELGEGKVVPVLNKIPRNEGVSLP
jgi:hypothetical protein